MSKLASLAVAALLACTVTPVAGRQLTYSWPTNVGLLNPHLYAPNQMFAQASVYEPLVRYRDDGTIEPWLATAWTISRDGRTYDFALRPGVTFSDGTPFDAAAVKANFDAILANRSRHAWLDLTRQIDRTEIVGPLAFRLVLKAAHDPTLRELSLPRPFRFVSPAAMGEGGTTAGGIRAPVGTGPWRLVETRLGVSDTFAANPTYWGAKPAFERLVVKVIPDPNTRAIALQTGEVDLVYGAAGQIPSEAFLRLRDQTPAFSAAVSRPPSAGASSFTPCSPMRLSTSSCPSGRSLSASSPSMNDASCRLCRWRRGRAQQLQHLVGGGQGTGLVGEVVHG